jgi:hypothetical protein
MPPEGRLPPAAGRTGVIGSRFHLQADGQYPIATASNAAAYARSSDRRIEWPRDAASAAIPIPVAPPPMTTISRYFPQRRDASPIRGAIHDAIESRVPQVRNP